MLPDLRLDGARSGDASGGDGGDGALVAGRRRIQRGVRRGRAPEILAAAVLLNRNGAHGPQGTAQVPTAARGAHEQRAGIALRPRPGR